MLTVMVMPLFVACSDCSNLTIFNILKVRKYILKSDCKFDSKPFEIKRVSRRDFRSPPLTGQYA